MRKPSLASARSRFHQVWPLLIVSVPRILLGALFFLSALHVVHFNAQWHLHDYYFYLAMRIDGYQVLPDWALQLTAVVLPWVEMAIGMAMLSGVCLRAAGLIATVILSGLTYAFTLAQLSFVPDGSLVIERSHLNPALMIRDSIPVLLAAVITVSAFTSKRRQSTPAA